MAIKRAVTKGRRFKPPAMSDDEAKLRLFIPDGLQTDGSHPTVCGPVQDPVNGPLIPHNPLTKKGRKIMAAMKSQYGSRGEEVFHRSKNKGTIRGVEKS